MLVYIDCTYKQDRTGCEAQRSDRVYMQVQYSAHNL